MRPTAVLGDVHGDYDRMLELVGDLDPDVDLVLVGDYFDRWDQGIEVVEWIMGRPNTTALMGNHDALMLAVVEEVHSNAQGRSTESWLWNGGKMEDLHRLLEKPAVIEWLSGLPAMAMIDETLVQHCDSPVYANYGDTVDAVNLSVRRRAGSGDVEVLFQLFADLCKRRQFYSAADLRAYLKLFGATRLVHGHTPHVQPQALQLFNGTIVNVDGALSRGFGTDRPRGFLHWLHTGDGAAAGR